MNKLAIANHPLIWIAAMISVALIFVQSFIFVKKSLSVGKTMGIKDKQMKDAMNSSMVASIGPSFVILVGLVTLMTKVGAPTAWMRLSLIGSVSHELMAAEFAETFAKSALGSGATQEIIFTNAVWVMALGAVCWPLFTGLFTHKIEKFRGIIAKDNKKNITLISSAASLGAFAFLVADNIMPTMDFKFNSKALACILGGIFMAILTIIGKKTGKRWVKEWGLSIAMFLSMIITALVV